MTRVSEASERIEELMRRDRLGDATARSEVRTVLEQLDDAAYNAGYNDLSADDDRDNEAAAQRAEEARECGG
jgi:hypothetical protein